MKYALIPIALLYALAAISCAPRQTFDDYMDHGYILCNEQPEHELCE